MKILFAALSCSLALAQTMTIEEYEPKSTLVVPQHPVQRAKYPFIDVHNHQSRCLKPECVDKLVADMDALNLRVMVNLSGGYGDKLKRTVVAQKGRYQGPLRGVRQHRFQRTSTIRIIRARAAAQLEKDVKNGAQGLKIFKNFGMDVEGRQRPAHPRRRSALRPGLRDCARKLKIPVLIHTGEPAPFFQPQDKYNERWLELKHPIRRAPARRSKFPSWETLMAEQHNLFAKHPKTIFINAHLGWLGANLAELGQLMDKLPNMYTEIGAVLVRIGTPAAIRARSGSSSIRTACCSARTPGSRRNIHYYFRVLETADEYFDYYRKYHAFWKLYGLDLPDEVLQEAVLQERAAYPSGHRSGGISQ